MSKKFFIGSDHAGWALKQKLGEYLNEMGYEVVDCGASDYVKGDDYPDYDKLVARAVLENPGSEGLLVCDTGIGMSISANRFKGIRAALVVNELMARRSREHNNANVLVLGSKLTDYQQALKIIDAWVETKFSGDERHVRRLAKIEEER